MLTNKHDIGCRTGDGGVTGAGDQPAGGVVPKGRSRRQEVEIISSHWTERREHLPAVCAVYMAQGPRLLMGAQPALYSSPHVVCGRVSTDRTPPPPPSPRHSRSCIQKIQEHLALVRTPGPSADLAAIP